MGGEGVERAGEGHGADLVPQAAAGVGARAHADDVCEVRLVLEHEGVVGDGLVPLLRHKQRGCGEGEREGKEVREVG